MVPSSFHQNSCGCWMAAFHLLLLLYKNTFHICHLDLRRLFGTIHVHPSSGSPPDPWQFRCYAFSLLPAAHPCLPYFQIMDQYYNNLKYHIPDQPSENNRWEKSIPDPRQAPSDNPICWLFLSDLPHHLRWYHKNSSGKSDMLLFHATISFS